MEAGQVNLEEFVQHEATLLQHQDEAVEQLELSLDQKEADELDRLSEVTVNWAKALSVLASPLQF